MLVVPQVLAKFGLQRRDRAELEQLDEQGMAAWDRHDVDGFIALFADDFV
jgi:hypothetical protein